MMRIGNNSQGIWQLFIKDERWQSKYEYAFRQWGHRKETIVAIPLMICVPDTSKIPME